MYINKPTVLRFNKGKNNYTALIFKLFVCHLKECFSMPICFSPHPVMERETNSILVIVCSYTTPH